MQDRSIEILRDIETKLDEVDALISELPIRTAVKNKLSDLIGAVFEEVTDAVDLAPTDGNNMCKVATITDKILVKHHPKFQNASKKQLAWFKSLNEDDAFSRSIGNLVAEALAHASPTIEYTDANGMDYTDGTDKKVVTLDSSHGVKIKVGECGAITKKGDLRVTIFNPHINELHYLYIPYKFWIEQVKYHKGGLRTLEFTYSKRTQTFTQGYHQWVVDSFEDLVAKKPNEVDTSV